MLKTPGKIDISEKRDHFSANSIHDEAAVTARLGEALGNVLAAAPQLMGDKFKFEPDRKPDAVVPCNGCTLCCRGDAISIHPEQGDNPADYQTVPHFIPELAAQGVLMLAHKADKSCVYLGAGGCTIHGKAPLLCREFDCREFVRRLGRTKARQLVKKGVLSAGPVRRGLELIVKGAK